MSKVRLAFTEQQLKGIRLFELADLKKKYISKRKVFIKALQKARKSGNGRTDMEMALQIGDPRIRFVAATMNSTSGHSNMTQRPALIDDPKDVTELEDQELLNNETASEDFNRFKLDDPLVEVVRTIEVPVDEVVNVVPVNEVVHEVIQENSLIEGPTAGANFIPEHGEGTGQPDDLSGSSAIVPDQHNGGGKVSAKITKQPRMSLRDQLLKERTKSFSSAASSFVEALRSKKDQNNNQNKPGDSICELVGQLLTRRLQNSTPARREAILTSHIFPALSLLTDEEAAD